MNRRSFLQSLAAIGASLAVAPEALARLPETEIDALWGEAVRTPLVFYVRDEYPFTLTTRPKYNAEMEEMSVAFGVDGEEPGPMDCSTGQGDALRFFSHFEHIEDFDIRIVEGDCPGSSYFAAELRSSIEEANAIAESLSIPIRFAWQGI